VALGRAEHAGNQYDLQDDPRQQHDQKRASERP
jgi:hypothetical protein